MARRHEIAKCLFAQPNSEEQARNENFANRQKEIDDREREKFAKKWHYDVNNDCPFPGQGSVSWGDENNGIRIGIVNNSVDIENSAETPSNRISIENRLIDISDENEANVISNGNGSSGIDNENRSKEFYHENRTTIEFSNENVISLEFSNENVASLEFSNESDASIGNEIKAGDKVEDVVGIPEQSTPVKRQKVDNVKI